MKISGEIALFTRQAVAASLLSAALLVGGPAIAEDEQTSADFKMLGGGASTLQSGRRITITRGVNLDNTDWKGENLKGVAFQQSVVRKANFDKANLFSASFFDADLAGSTFVGARGEPFERDRFDDCAGLRAAVAMASNATL